MYKISEMDGLHVPVLKFYYIQPPSEVSFHLGSNQEVGKLFLESHKVKHFGFADHIRSVSSKAYYLYFYNPLKI